MSRKPDAEETFVQLVVSHQAALRAFVLSMLPGSPHVDDVIQETNAEIWQKRGDFRIGTQFKSWMFSVAKYKVMSVWRDQSRSIETALPEEMLVQLLEKAESGGFVHTEEKFEALRSCLRALKPTDHKIILQRYMEEESIAKISQQYGRTSESMKTTLHRIRISLKGCISNKLKSVNA